MGAGIAAALDAIRVNGKTYRFSDLSAKKKEIGQAVGADGCIRINYLGQECYVTWGIGHLCRLYNIKEYNPEYDTWRKVPIPFIPQQFKVKPKEGPKNDKFNVTARTKKQVAKCKELFAKADLIINATDNDREGELIFEYLREYLRCRTPFKRAIFDEKTEKGFREAFQEQNLIDGSERRYIINAGKARSQADWIVGINGTIAYTNRTGALCTLGRVKTPALAMIVRREKEIQNFVSQPFWKIEANFVTDDGETYSGIYEQDRFDNRADAEKVYNDIKGAQSAIVVNVEKKVEQREPPTLFTQTLLQSAVARRYGLGMEETLRASQSLYDKGFTTYPRTTSNVITENEAETIGEKFDALEQMPQYAPLLRGRPRKIVNRKRYIGKADSHTAITPTGVIPTGLSPDEEKVYDVIARRFICMLYENAEVEITTVTTAIHGHNFITKGSRVSKAGWTVVEGRSKDENLPELQRNQVVGVHDIEVKEGRTEPPKRYTIASLPTAMANVGKDIDDEHLAKILLSKKVNGIGTEATRAGIITDLIDKKYIEIKQKRYYPTELGTALIDSLVVEDLKSAELTAHWEEQMSEIEAGRESLDDFMNEVYQETTKWCQQIAAAENVGPVSKFARSSGGKNMEVVAKCPICGGDIQKLDWGYGCSNYQGGCQFRIAAEIGKKKITKTMIKQLCESGATEWTSGFVSQKTGNTYTARFRMVNNEIKMEFPTQENGGSSGEIIAKCPVCGGNIVKTPWGYGCSNYRSDPSCAFSVSGVICKKKITPSMVKTLCSKGETAVYDNFVSKAGKKFSAKIVVKDSGTALEFPER